MPASANPARARRPSARAGRAGSAPPGPAGSEPAASGDAATGPPASTVAASTGSAAGTQPDYRVEALAKGLRVLSVFSEQRPTWRINAIAAEVSLPLPTAYRIVMTLTAEGYLDHLPSG